jgi:steroid 5-alpha reductase family enzyme
MVSIESEVTSNHKPFVTIAFAYLIAAVVAIMVGYLFRNSHPVFTVLVADIAATGVIYASGRVYHNASFYDPYWSVQPMAIALYFMSKASTDAVILRQVIVWTIVFIWGLRLTYNWASQWRWLKHEDWRYQDLRKKTKGMFGLVDLIGIELMPTILVFLGCLSLYSALVTGKNTFGVLDVFAVIVTAGAILIETIADEQLRRFISKMAPPGAIIDRGLWTYSRHPNYFSEVMFWWGLFIFGLAADYGYWWTIIGPVAITALFVFISIPLMERRSLEKRPGYREYRKQLPALFPWFRKT